MPMAAAEKHVALRLVVLFSAISIWLSQAMAGNMLIPAGGYSALCVVGKNENLNVAEWLDYHKCVGFDHVYLYDHNSTVPLSEPAANHIAAGFVTYIPFSGLHTKFKPSEGFTSNLDRFMMTVQGRAYKDCIEAYGARHRFIGFIDFDEFVVLYDKSIQGINSLLKQYEQHAALSLYWSILGSSGFKLRAPGVVDSYIKCVPMNSKYNTQEAIRGPRLGVLVVPEAAAACPHEHVTFSVPLGQFKSFVNTEYKPIMYSPHRAEFHKEGQPDAHAVDENHVRIATGRNKNSTHVRAAVHHYATKSEEEFLIKLKRGGGAGVTRSRGLIRVLDRICTEDCLAAIETRDRLCPAA